MSSKMTIPLSSRLPIHWTFSSLSDTQFSSRSNSRQLDLSWHERGSETQVPGKVVSVVGGWSDNQNGSLSVQWTPDPLDLGRPFCIRIMWDRIWSKFGIFILILTLNKSLHIYNEPGWTDRLRMTNTITCVVLTILPIFSLISGFLQSFQLNNCLFLRITNPVG